MSLTTSLATALAEGSLKIVDLTNTLSAETPTLRLPEPFPNLIDFRLEEVAAYNESGPFWKHHNIHTGEHIGTHIDAPVHWASGKEGKDVSQIEPERLIGPAAVLDVSAAVAQNADFLLEVEHVKAWEAEHGPLPANGWLLLRTGWDKYADDKEAFLNADESGSHTPGISSACAKWLAEETELSGYGVETVGIDQGNAAELDPPFPAHYFLLGSDKYGITSLQNLDKLPATGAILVVAPLPIVGGTGSPARVYALLDS
ncbi:cyclase family protein [Nesterenkonia haasae]|uniref:cyclase family protein n=1 Tax=Nesterenkonia haasae TaxID=2587813 RepID=UPI00139106E7|nr:cyclase family protein [Nesterenkonia haasae]NDK31127.1 cyclase family protein [Nesterenkonia haasae]